MKKIPEIVNCRLVKEPYYISKEKVSIETSDHAIAYFGNDLKNYPQEAIEVIYLNNQLRPINMSIVSKGTRGAALIPYDQIFRIAILTNASSMIMMHNHPSGVVLPSKEDKKAFKDLENAARIMGYKILDSIIVGAGSTEYYSMRSEVKSSFCPVREYVIPSSAEIKKKADMEKYLEPYEIEHENQIVAEYLQRGKNR